MQANSADRAVLRPSGWLIVRNIIPPAAIDFLAANEPQGGIKKLIIHNTRVARLRPSEGERGGDRIKRRSRSQSSSNAQRFPNENARFSGGSNRCGSGIGGLLELDRSHWNKKSQIKSKKALEEIDGRMKKKEMEEEG